MSDPRYPGEYDPQGEFDPQGYDPNGPGPAGDHPAGTDAPESHVAGAHPGHHAARSEGPGYDAYDGYQPDHPTEGTYRPEDAAGWDTPAGDPSVEPSEDADELASGVPYRAIAMVLLTLVVIAVAIGLVQLFTGSDEDEAAEPASQSVVESPSDAGGADSAEGAESGTADGQQQDGSAQQDGAGAEAPADGAQNGQSGAAAGGQGGQPAEGANGANGVAGANGATTAGEVPVRVYNNSTISGLADDVAGTLRGGGADVQEIGNYSDGNVPTSGVYYGDGAGERAEAERIAGELGIEARPRFEGLGGATPGVIVIVTQDMQGR